MIQNLIMSENISLERFTEITDLDDEAYWIENPEEGFLHPPLPNCQQELEQ